MINLSLNLPKYRLHVHLVRRRGLASENPLLPKFEDIKNVRSGSKVSRFFRHVFEHKSLKKLFGVQLGLMIIASSLIPTYAFEKEEPSQTVILESNTPLTTKKAIQLPLVETFTVSQGYGLFHPGVDMATSYGSPVYPIKDGTVEAVSHSNFGYGNAIIVNHGENITSIYAHLSKTFAKEGQEVKTYTKIGEVGTSGHTTGPHLHLEVRNNGISINPFSILPTSN